MLPDFLRYFADTSDTPLGKTALEYCKSLCRIAPVRVASLTGGLAGPWTAFAELTLTPMVGNFVNCVCCHPSQWAYTVTLQPPTHVFSPEADNFVPQKGGEPVSGRMELYTAGVRNVLFVGKMPIVRGDLDEALKYEGIVAKSLDDHRVFAKYARPSTVLKVGIPGVDHGAVRIAVLGDTVPSEGVYR